MARRVVDDDMRRYYDQRAHEYDDWWLGTGLFAERSRPGWSEELGELVSVIGALPPARTLDVACGSGFLTRHLQGDVVGLDQSESMVAVAAERMPDVRMVQGDAVPLPFADGEFERVFTSHFYGHLRRGEREQFLQEGRRVGGQLVVLDSARREDVPSEEHQQRPERRLPPHGLQALLRARRAGGRVGRRQRPALRALVRGGGGLAAAGGLDHAAFMGAYPELRGDRAGGPSGAAATCLMQTSKPTVALRRPGAPS